MTHGLISGTGSNPFAVHSGQQGSGPAKDETKNKPWRTAKTERASFEGDDTADAPWRTSKTERARTKPENKQKSNLFGSGIGAQYDEEKYPVVDRKLENIAKDFEGPDDFKRAIESNDSRVDPSRHDVSGDGSVTVMDWMAFNKVNTTGGFNAAAFARSGSASPTTSSKSGSSTSTSSSSSESDQDLPPWRDGQVGEETAGGDLSGATFTSQDGNLRDDDTTVEQTDSQSASGPSTSSESFPTTAVLIVAAVVVLWGVSR